jgi:type I restriction enzyme S subunit
MNVETLLEKFELLTAIPNAVPIIRELLVELAIRGRLVEQNSQDEPATTLLNSPSVDRAQSYSERPTNHVELRLLRPQNVHLTSR